MSDQRQPLRGTMTMRLEDARVMSEERIALYAERDSLRTQLAEATARAERAEAALHRTEDACTRHRTETYDLAATAITRAESRVLSDGTVRVILEAIDYEHRDEPGVDCGICNAIAELKLKYLPQGQP